MEIFALLMASAFAQAPSEVEPFSEWCRDILASQLQGEVVDVGEEPLTLSVGGDDGFNVTLDRPWKFCAETPTECERATTSYLSQVAATINPQSQDAIVQPAEIRVAVRRQSYVDLLKSRLGDDIVVEHLADQLWQVYMHDTPAAARPVRPAEVEALGLNKKSLKKLALKNLDNTVGDLESHLKKLPLLNGVGYISTGDYYTSSLIVEHKPWKKLAKDFDGGLLVSVPEPGTILYTDARQENALFAMIMITRDMAVSAERPLSDVVLHWTKKGWVKAN